MPVIGCQCKVCQSNNPKDKRLRCSILVETASTRLLVDAGPDFRQQILPQPFRKINGILVTHSHYDHVGGMDDIRPYCQFGEINVYADPLAKKGMLEMLPYCFAEHRYPGVPAIGLHEIQAGQQMTIGDIDILPIRVMHDKLPILGFRFGPIAYITDMKSIEADQLTLLQGQWGPYDAPPSTLIVNALRFEKPHHSHQLVADAIAFSQKVGARRTLLTHICHDMGLHDEVNSQRLPQGVELAYDGQVLEFSE